MTTQVLSRRAQSSTQPAGLEPASSPTPRLRNSSIAGVLGGLVYGYTAGVIAPAGISLTNDFGLSSFGLGLVAAAMLFGALIGALSASRLKAVMTTRRMLLLFAAAVGVGSVASAIVPAGDTGLLVASRILVGVGIGVISVTAPMYLSETAPSRVRGAVVSTFQLLICVGSLLAFLTGLIFTGTEAWRPMFASAAIACAALVVVMLRSTETPADLSRLGRIGELTNVLAVIEPDRPPQDLVAEHNEAQDRPTLSWRALFAGRRRVLGLALVLSIGQILTGINAIMYFAPQIFAKAGLSTATEAIAATIVVGTVNLVATLIAVRYIDRFGRRPLLLFGLIGMTVSATAIAVAGLAAGASGVGGYITLFAVMVFVFSFAVSMGPVVWVMVGELFPPDMRDKGMSLVIGGNWGMNLMLSLLFLPLVSVIGMGWVFAGFAVINLALMVFVAHRVPETRGLTLTEIEAIVV